jgi:hypothetical protein
LKNKSSQRQRQRQRPSQQAKEDSVSIHMTNCKAMIHIMTVTTILPPDVPTTTTTASR